MDNRCSIIQSPNWGFLGSSSAVSKCQEICAQPKDHFIITNIISDWRDTHSKWPLARNPDRSWWHHHISLKLFWPQPMAPWTTGVYNNNHPQTDLPISPPVLSFFPSISLHDLLCNPTDLIWRKGTLFEAMTGRTSPSSDGLLAEVFPSFPPL